MKKTAEFEKFIKNELENDDGALYDGGYDAARAFKQYMKAYERLAVNNYLKPCVDGNPDSAHYYPWELMGETIKLHYQELHGKLRRRNYIRKLLGR